MKKLIFIITLLLTTQSTQLFAIDCSRCQQGEIKIENEYMEVYSFNYPKKIYHGNPRYNAPFYHIETKHLYFSTYEDCHKKWNAMRCEYKHTVPPVLSNPDPVPECHCELSGWNPHGGPTFSSTCGDTSIIFYSHQECRDYINTLGNSN